MRQEISADTSISLALLAEIQAAANDEHRSATDVIREALERYLTERQRHRSARPKRTAAEAAARLLELSKDNPLPKGMTIEDMIAHGRA